MKIQLLKGSFSPKEIEKLITELILVKIKFHEDKIQNSDEEETIKMRENRIIKLQNDLKEVRSLLNNSDSLINVDAEIEISKSNG
jgi:hypothetical protein